MDLRRLIDGRDLARLPKEAEGAENTKARQRTGLVYFRDGWGRAE